MGADYKAKALIGLKVDTDKLYTTKMVKAFEHDYPESMKFDPQTGKPLWEEEQEPIDINEDGESLAGFRLLWGTDHEDAYVAVAFADRTYSNGGSRDDFSALPDIAAEKAKLKAALEPFGLWNEKAFGLYTVLYCTY